MGSATREALAAAQQALTAQGNKADLAVAEELFAASCIIADSSQLRGAISDPAKSGEEKSALVSSVFSSRVSAPTSSLLASIVAQRWSSDRDLLAGIEEIGIRTIAGAAPASVELDAELFAFGGAVSSNADLELALRSKRSDPASKAHLIERLLTGKASEQTIAIVRQFVVQPRGRSVRVALRQSAAIIADQAGLAVATVTSAKPLASAQLDKLRSGLAVRYGRDLQLNQILDPTLIGGLRIQVGDDVIDGSVATRINDVRLQLAG